MEECYLTEEEIKEELDKVENNKLIKKKVKI